MRRWAATTPLACASIVFGIRAGAAGTPPRRPALDEARPHSIKFIESSISVRPDTVTDSAGVATVVARCRIGVTVRNASRKPVWVRVHFESAGNTSAEPAPRLEPKRSYEFACPVDTVMADRDYPMDVTVSAGALTDTLERIATRLRFDEVEVRRSLSQLRHQRAALARRSLPRTYEHMTWVGEFKRRPGTLVVEPDELVFQEKERHTSIPRAAVRRVSASTFPASVRVEYEDGTHTRRMDLVPPGWLGTLLRPWSTSAVDDVVASIQELIDRTPLDGGAHDKAATAMDVPPWTEAKTSIGVFRREGYFFKGGGGLGMMAVTGDSLDYTRVGGIPFSLGFGGFVCPWLAAGVRLESMLGISADLILLPVDYFVGPDLEFWSRGRWMFAAGFGAAGSVASDHGALGIPLRLGYRPPGARPGDESRVIALEYFPILHRDGSAWTVALVVELHFGRHLKRDGSH